MKSGSLSMWKVKREVWRLLNQGDYLVHRVFGRSLIHTYTRVFVDRKVQFLKGDLPRGTRVAVYLIFPTEGLLASHRIALRYITKSGYAPVVVSNLPLPPEDLAELKKLCADLILRPNYGYDFGGYRDAMRLLLPDLNRLDYLAFFNDSSWFPVRPHLNWLKQGEEMQRDYVGSVCHEGLPAGDFLDFAKTPWVVDTERKDFHYGSYSLLVGPRLLSSNTFAEFWRRFCPTSIKSFTIRRGEIGLARWVIDHGFSHGALCPSDQLDQLLDDLPSDRLREITINLIDTRNQHMVDLRRSALAAEQTYRATLRNVILSFVAYRGPAYVLQDFDTRERCGNFIKKSPLSWSRDDAEATLRILARFDNPEASVFLREARQIFDASYGSREA